MRLPVSPPLLPMLAKRVDAMPEGADGSSSRSGTAFARWSSATATRSSSRAATRSRSNRYFPELLEPLQGAAPARCVLDGEIVIAGGSGLDFEALQLRLHPAASRVKMLAEQMPASIVFLDLLCVGDAICARRRFASGARALEALLARRDAADPPHAGDTRSRRRAGLVPPLRGRRARRRDGQAARRHLRAEQARDAQGEARARLRLRRRRLPLAQGRRGHAVGSLLLGLYDDAGALQHVGVCASFTDAKRRELVDIARAVSRERAATIRGRRGRSQDDDAGMTSAMPGGQSRWSQGKDLSWEPLRPELVVEVAYDHMQGTRFRHTAQFRRWRTDKRPSDCTYAQLEVVAAARARGDLRQRSR